MRHIISFLAALAMGGLAGCTTQPGSPTNGALSGTLAPWVHDPSTIIRCKDKYWLFATGTGVRSLCSNDLFHWQIGPRVFEVFPAWTKDIVPNHRGYFWAPDVIRIKQRYLLYYSVSSWGKNTSAIGLAATPTLDPAEPARHWSDEGIVIRSTAADDFNAIDPSVMLDAEGRLWMAFGSFWSGIKLLQLDPVTGKRLSENSPVYSLARHASIEAPCLYRHGAYYYLFMNWGRCCRGTNSTYEIRVGRGAQIIGPYRDRDGLDLLQGGGTPFLSTAGSFVGPGQTGVFTVGNQQWLSCHFYDGNRNGKAVLAIRKLSWTSDGWPVVDANRRD